MTSDLRNRLLLLLVLPLCALATIGVWLDYRSADEAAGQHDQRLLRLLPALSDSVLAPAIRDNDPPLLLLAPPLEDFLRQERASRATACATLRASCCWATTGCTAPCPPPRRPSSTAWSTAA